ncbi:MFS family permease [Agromyces cerinus]|uniref:MFS transporter n=1 Tax=Agromyces cerinus TaxID=33878 RepID=UPI0027DC653C|nr:MFS transporter [Agromyces cerinus]MBM7829378.1 MFS family permease [Agromyces cerinus]
MREEVTRTGTDAEPRSREVLRVPAFALFWSATTIRAFGSAIAGVAFQVLIVTVLNATPIEISILSALGVVPYLFLGLIVGALMDRWRRQRTLIITSVGRAIVLGSIPVLLLLDALTFWSLAGVMLTLGVLTLFADSAAQPLLPNLVPRSSLVMANARLGQSETVAGTAGPALGGALFTLLGAPILFAFDAVINAVSAVLQSRISVQEAAPQPRPRGRHIGHDIVEGLRYTYRHRTLRPLALSIHIWFLANSIVSTVFAVFVLRELDLAPGAFGVALAFGGVGGFLGALFAPRIGMRLGAGRAILLGRALAIVPWLALAVLPIDASTDLGVLMPVVSAAQFVFGLSTGIEDANDTGYRQAVAPDAIQGRMNSTIRTVNRVVFFLGALLTGLLATLLGYQSTFGVAAIIFTVAALVVAVSPLRSARHEDAAETHA